MEAPLFQPFITRRQKMPSRPDGFMLYAKLRVDSFSTSELLYPNLKNKLRIFRARPNFYNLVLELLIVHLTRVVLLSRLIITKTNGHAYIYSCGVLVFWDSSKDFQHSCQTEPVHPRKHFQQCSSSSYCYCNGDKEFTGSYTENQFWFLQFNLKQIRNSEMVSQL